MRGERDELKVYQIDVMTAVTSATSIAAVGEMTVVRMALSMGGSQPL
jgi:hypothetical protein